MICHNHNSNFRDFFYSTECSCNQCRCNYQGYSSIWAFFLLSLMLHMSWYSEFEMIEVAFCNISSFKKLRGRGKFFAWISINILLKNYKLKQILREFQALIAIISETVKQNVDRFCPTCNLLQYIPHALARTSYFQWMFICLSSSISCPSFKTIWKPLQGS